MTNLTDRELLELAAYAAGLNAGTDGMYDNLKWWNPLKDNGQAFELMCKLRLAVHYSDNTNEVGVGNGYSDYYEYHDSLDVAMRRAIVRAAADMAGWK